MSRWWYFGVAGQLVGWALCIGMNDWWGWQIGVLAAPWLAVEPALWWARRRERQP